jgi:glycine cleavage system transcriptional repressor
MNHYLLVAIGKDRPGIVAKISKFLYENNFNIENSSMAKLNNEFSMMLIVSNDKEIDLNRINGELSKIADEMGLNLIFKKVDEIEEYQPQCKIYRLIVYGGDKPGIVYKVSDLLAKKEVNIIDLRTEKSNDMYVLIAELEVPENIIEEELKNELSNLSNELNVDITLESDECIKM